MPLLPLDTFRHLMGYNPWHFWGLSNADVPVTSACNDLLYKYTWQNADAVSREAMVEGIETAEARLLEQLGYSVAPHYVTDTIPLVRLGVGSDGRWASVQLGEGKVQAVGVETLTMIGNANVTFSDQDGDGLDESWVATIATTETDIAKIAVYFTASDRLDGDAVGDQWRIQPVKITLDGATATIRGRSWLLVKPVRYEGVNASSNANTLDPDDASIFVTQVAIYRRTTNPDGQTVANSQGVLYWETGPYPAWACCGTSGLGDNSTDPAAVASAVARVGIRDASLGLVFPGQAIYNSTTSAWKSVSWGLCRAPDRALIRYLAGDALGPDGQMARKWQEIVARLAAAEMPHRIQAADTANRWIYHWQFDMSRSAGVGDEQYSISQEDLNNPLGTRRGQVDTWKRIKGLRLLRGVSI